MPHSRRETDVAVTGQALTRSEHSLLAPARHLVKTRKRTAPASWRLSKRPPAVLPLRTPFHI